MQNHRNFHWVGAESVGVKNVTVRLLRFTKDSTCIAENTADQPG